MRNPAEHDALRIQSTTACFLSLGLTKLHTRPSPLSIMPSNNYARQRGRMNCMFVNFLSRLPCVCSLETRIWDTSGARTGRFNPLILQIDNNCYKRSRNSRCFAYSFSRKPILEITSPISLIKACSYNITFVESFWRDSRWLKFYLFVFISKSFYKLIILAQRSSTCIICSRFCRKRQF